MYRSIHTTVFAPDERLVQAQIRTFDMDKVASFGLTTYWDINKGQARDEMQKDLKGQPLDELQKGYFCYDKAVKYNTLSEYAKHIREQVQKQEKGNGK